MKALLEALSTQHDREVEDFQVLLGLDALDGSWMVIVELDEETLIWLEDEDLEEAVKELLEGVE